MQVPHIISRILPYDRKSNGGVGHGWVKALSHPINVSSLGIQHPTLGHPQDIFSLPKSGWGCSLTERDGDFLAAPQDLLLTIKREFS